MYPISEVRKSGKGLKCEKLSIWLKKNNVYNIRHLWQRNNTKKILMRTGNIRSI